MALTKVQTIGIETGVSLTGVTTVTTLNASTDTLSVGGTVNFGGNVSIAGTLTYEDVTNIDSVGIITARSDISIADKIIHTGDTNTAIRFPAADTFTVETGGSERVRIDSSGNLLIGTTSATSELTVRGSGTVAAFEGTGGSSSILLKDVDDGSLAYIVVNGGNFDIQTSGSSYSTKLRVTPAGLVGIGENAPDNLLHIKSTDTPAIELEQDDGTSYKGLIKLAGNDLEIRGSSGQMEFYNGSQDGDSSALRMVIQNSGRLHIGDRTNQNATNFSTASVNISKTDDIATSFNKAACYLHIGNAESTLNGLYPIGFGFSISDKTHVPAYIAYKTIDSAGAEHGDLLFATRNVTTDTEPTERLRISSAGYMGLGTGSPRRHFHIHESASGTTVGLQMTNAGTGESNDSQGFQLKVGGDGHAELAQMENSNLRIFTNAIERLRIVSTGRVAIGNDTNNASPTGLFQVKAADGEAADLYVGVFENLEATAGQSYGVNIRAGSNNTDHGLRVRNKANDATHFLVSGAGQVTKPLQTAFMAALNQNGSLTSGIGKLSSKVGNSYTNVTLNTGNCYNSSTTTFTAPVDGVYVFSNQISSSSDMPANSYLGAEFYKNGSRISCGWRRSHSQGYQRVTANIILSLSANDTVEPGVESAEGGTLNGGSTTLAQYNHFLGYLLH